MHHRLPTGKMKFTAPYPCPHCNKIFDQYLERDHFLMCEKSTINKEKRTEKLGETIKSLHTPPSIIKVILQNVSSYYKILPTNNIKLIQQTLPEETNFCLTQQIKIG